MEEILYVIGLKKNLLFVSILEYKGFHVIFMENQAYLWSKNQNINTATIIGVREGGLYNVPGNYIASMTHHTIIPCNIWHRMFGHLHFRELPVLQVMVKDMPSFDYVHDIVCRGCALEKNVKNKFPRIHTRYK